MRRGTLLLREEVGQRHLAVPDLDDEDARLRLAALLAGGAVLLEPDRAVDAHEAHAPEGVADRRGLVTAGDADRLDDRRDAVVTAEPLGQPLERMAALGPLVHERAGELRSEERRVGKECRSRCARERRKKKKSTMC